MKWQRRLSHWSRQSGFTLEYISMLLYWRQLSNQFADHVNKIGTVWKLSFVFCFYLWLFGIFFCKNISSHKAILQTRTTHAISKTEFFYSPAYGIRPRRLNRRMHAQQLLKSRWMLLNIASDVSSKPRQAAVRHNDISPAGYLPLLATPARRQMPSDPSHPARYSFMAERASETVDCSQRNRTELVQTSGPMDQTPYCSRDPICSSYITGGRGKTALGLHCFLPDECK